MLDYRNPDYQAIFAKRIANLQRMRKDAGLLAACRIHYRNNPIDFIADWGVTLDPRLIKRNLPAVIPLVPFQRQREWLQWLIDRWQAGENGLTEKSRDMGCSVNAMALFATLALFYDNFVAGVGSRKEDLVDRVGDPDTLFFKSRMFLSHLPSEFRGQWDERNKALSSHMKIDIPSTGSVIKGEAGNNIGRGGRVSIYLVDESAFLANGASVDASLSQTTDCRLDLSSVNGRDNPFAERRFSGNVPVFTFNWKEDPRKDDAWYAKQCKDLNPLIVAQEIDLDYTASKAGVLIPSAWVQAAINAHVKLGILPSGKRSSALDIADEGIDKNAQAGKYGIMLNYLKGWHGKGSDIFQTVQKAFMACDEQSFEDFQYDSDGLGAGARGDARVINEQRARDKVRTIEAIAFRGSGEVVNPDEEIIKGDDKNKGRTNKDFFANRKAQAWWHLRTLFQNTYRAVVEGLPYDPDTIISIAGDIEERAGLEVELSQPTYSINTAGKILVDKAPDGMKSPNYADAVMILYAPQERRKSSIFDF